MKSLPDSVLAAMRKTNELFDSELVKHQNFAALDRVYTSDASILPPGAPMIEGRDQIKAFWKQAIASMGVTSAKLATVSAEAAGDGILEIGKADLTVGDGQTVTVKYVVYWKQENGTWKWHVDIWNTN